MDCLAITVMIPITEDSKENVCKRAKKNFKLTFAVRAKVGPNQELYGTLNINCPPGYSAEAMYELLLKQNGY